MGLANHGPLPDISGPKLADFGRIQHIPAKFGKKLDLTVNIANFAEPCRSSYKLIFNGSAEYHFSNRPTAPSHKHLSLRLESSYCKE